MADDSSELREDVRDSVATGDSVNIRDSYQHSEVRDSVMTYGTSVAGESYLETEEVLDEKVVSAIDDDDEPTPWYKRKRFWIACMAVNLVLAAILIPILILVVFPEVAQSSINKSKLHFSSLQVNPPMDQDTFVMNVHGNVTNAGSYKATLSFPDELNFEYNGKVVAKTTMPTLKVSGGHADFYSVGNVTIVDQDGYTAFAKDSMTKSVVTIKLVGGVTVKSMGLTKKGLKLDKEVDIVGANSFNGDVISKDINLAENAPGVIAVTANATIHNPSPIGLYAGNTSFDISYLGIDMFTANVSRFNLTAGVNNIELNGIVTKRKQEDGYAVGSFIASYLNGTKIDTKVRGISSVIDGKEVKWVQEALGAVTIDDPLVHDREQTITNIVLGPVTLDFVNGSAYAPLVTAPNVTADLHLPWRVNVSIVQARTTTMKMMFGGLEIADLQQANYGPASNTDTKAYLSVENAPLIVKNKAIFSTVMKTITMTSSLDIQVQGSVDTKAQLSIFDSPIDIQGITFQTTSKMTGLQGLNAQPTVISGLTIVGGAVDGLLLQINASMFNPSTNHIKMGDVNFALTYDGATIGSVQIPKFELLVGNNSVTALAKVNPVQQPKANDVFLAYLSGKQVPVTLMGTQQSTSIASLQEALASIKITSTTPIFNQTLIHGASLVIPEDIGKTGVALSNVQVFNPFDAQYEIIGMAATVTAGSITVGKINIPQLPADKVIAVPPKATVSAANLPMQLNLDPVQMFTLLRAAAVKSGQNVKPLDALLTLGGINVPGAEKVQPDPSIFAGFNLEQFVEKAMANLLVDIDLQTTVKIGDFQFPLPYKQQGVSATTDKTIDRLIPILGGPIVSAMVAKSQLVIDKTFIKNPTDGGFQTVLTGVIQNTGPLPAKITFPTGSQVQDGETVLGTLQMPPVEADGGKAVLNNIEGGFKIVNAGALTEFTKKLLLNQAATWTIRATITVEALGAAFPNIPLTQHAQLTGANGFKNAAKVLSFDLPSESEKGGLVTVIDFSLNNPSSVGIEVGRLQLGVFAEDIQLGEVESNGLSIQSKATTKAKLTGRLFRQESPKGLALLSKLFSAFLAGIDVPMTSKCLGAIPPSGSAKWLSDALQVITLQVVVPADPSKGHVIQGISIDQMTIVATPKTAYALDTSSDSITARIKPPYTFKMDIIQLEETITMINNGAPMAQLKIPLVPSKTDLGKLTVTSAYKNLPLVVIDGQQNNFNGFVKDLTIAKDKDFTIQGFSNATTVTPVGKLFLTGIKIGVGSGLKGMQGFQAKPVPIKDVDVISGRKDGLTISLKTNLFNPSVLTVGLGDVSLSFSVNKTVLGQVNLKDFKVVPGDNPLSPETILAPSLDNVFVALKTLDTFVGGGDQQIEIVGNRDSTPVESFKTALSSISIKSTLPGLKTRLVDSVALEILDTTLKDGIADGSFTLVNPFTVQISINSIQSNVTYSGLLLGTIDTTLKKPIVVDGKSKKTATGIPVKLNLDPKNLINVIIIAAKNAGIDISPLLRIIGGGGGGKASPVQKRDEADDLAKLILEVLNSIKLDIDFSGSVSIGEFLAPMSFPQKGVPMSMDKSAMKLFKLIGAPIVAKSIESSKLTVDTAVISKIRADQFEMELKASVTDAGKLAAKITFTKGFDVAFNDKHIGAFGLKPIEVNDNGDATIDQTTNFAIKDVQAFTEFAGVMLSQSQFVWDTTAKEVAVHALNMDFTGYTMDKHITLKGFNGLKDTTVTNIRVLGPAPDTGLALEVTTEILNPSSLSVELGDVTLVISLLSFPVGPAIAKGVTLPAGKKTTVKFAAEIARDPKLTPLVGSVFTAFLAGDKLNFVATGKDVNPPGSGDKVPWLQIPFGKLQLPIPYKPPKLSLIKSIAINVAKSGATADFDLVNPLDADFTIKTLKGKASSNGKVVGTVDFTVPGDGFTVPGKKEAVAKGIPITMGGSSSSLISMFKEAKDSKTDVLLDVELSNTDVEVGKYPATIGYSQDKVPSTITTPDSSLPFAAGLKDDDQAKEPKGSNSGVKTNAKSTEQSTQKHPS